MELNIRDISKFNVDDYLRRAFKCQCGRVHSVNLKKVIIEEGAIDKLPQILEDLGYNRVFMISDNNTYHVAGREVERALKNSGFIYKSLIYKRTRELIPNEEAIGEFMTAFDRDMEVIVTIGSGTLSDISKYMSFILDIPAIMIATAPSMDGYASDTSAFIIKNTKVSIRSKPPEVIIGDINILKEAPMDMILAGLGDMLGKYSAFRDWRLANIVIGEYYCPVVRGMVDRSLSSCVNDISLFVERDGQAIRHLMEGLVIVGIAMSFVGNSRPASGAEHHISHFWELMFLMDGREPIPHGTKVGVATLVVSSIAKGLTETDIDFAEVKNNMGKIDQERWREEIYRVYKDAAPEIIRLNEKPIEVLMKERKDRVEAIEKNWDEIVATIEEVPSTQELRSLFEMAGDKMATKPSDIGIDHEMLKNAILYGKEVRQRYTILQLLWDVGLLDQFASMEYIY